MSLSYEAVDCVDLESLTPNKSVRIASVIGSFRRRIYEVDVFMETEEHVFGIAFVYDNIPENEMFGDRPAVDPDSTRQEYVRFPRHGQLVNGALAIDTFPEAGLGDRSIESVDNSEWVRTNLAAAALGFFELPTST